MTRTQANTQAVDNIALPMSTTKHKAANTAILDYIDSYKADFVNILDYGAVGNGSTDDTAALTSALATGKDVFIPKGKTVTITGTTGNGTTTFAAVQMQTAQRLFGEGYGSALKVIADGRGIELNDRSIIENLRIIGAGKTAGLTKNCGITVKNKLYWTIRNLWLEQFAGDAVINGGGAVFVQGLTGAGANGKDGSWIYDCTFADNKGGLNFDELGEYVTVDRCAFLRNTTGFECRAGNTKFNNIQASLNTVGARFEDGSNNGHCVMSNSTLNHNTTNLVVNNLSIGYKFVGVMLYAGHVSLTNCSHVYFIGGDLTGGASYNLTLTNNTDIKVVGCYYPQSPASNALQKTLVSGSDFTIV